MKIAIDGPAGSGKSTVAKMLAERLGFTYVDTGAMYRAVAWKLKQHDIDPDNTDALRELLENTQFSISDSVLCMDGRKIGDEIRTPEISRLSSDVAKIAEVRHFLTAEQRRIAEKGNVIMEGARYRNGSYTGCGSEVLHYSFSGRARQEKIRTAEKAWNRGKL